MLLQGLLQRLELRLQHLLSVQQPDARHIRPVGFRQTLAQEVLFVWELQPRLEYRVARNLALVGGGKLPHLRTHSILFGQRVIGVVCEERGVRAQRDVHALAEVAWKRVLAAAHEQLAVAERAHGDAYLGEVEEVVQGWAAAQKEAVVNLVRDQEGGDQVIRVAGLAAVRAELEGVQALGGAQLVQHADVGVHIVHPVRVGRVVWVPIVVRSRQTGGQQRVLRQRLVVHAVEAHHGFQEVVQRRVGGGVQRVLEQRLKDVAQHVSKAGNLVGGAINVVDARHLHQPAHVIVGEAVRVEPLRQSSPLCGLAAIDRHPPLHHSVLVLLQLRDHFLGDFSQVPAIQCVVRLQEDLPQQSLAYNSSSSSR